MKRTEALKQNLDKDKSKEVQILQTLKNDAKFIKRSKRDIEDAIEDLEAELQKRLVSEVPLDKSTVEVTFASIQTQKQLLETYKEFEQEYL